MTFEEQFKNRTKIETLGGTISIIDIPPEKEITDISCPVFISSGWCSTPKLLKPLLKTISEKNRRVITADFENLDNVKYREGYLNREDFKARAILDILEKLEIEKIDIIGHSEGAVNTVSAVRKSPNKFRNVLLVAPAGMMQNESFLSLAYRITLSIFLWPVRKIKGNNRPFYHILQNLKFILFNPIQAIQEGHDLSKIHIGKDIKNIIAKGISVNIIYFKNDIVFPLKPTKKTSDENNISSYIISGTHNYIYSKPDIFWKKISSFLN